LQREYNEKHGITPETIRKNISRGIESEVEAHQKANAAVGQKDDDLFITVEYLNELEKEMLEAADALQFERAAAIRDRSEELKKHIGQRSSVIDFSKLKSERGRKKRHPKGRVPKPEK
jgi:excinuclease ABC subunit B